MSSPFKPLKLQIRVKYKPKKHYNITRPVLEEHGRAFSSFSHFHAHMNHETLEDYSQI
jgi:hypothetical protein